MAVPAMPGAGLVVIESELVLGSLEAVLDGPTAALDRHELFDGRAQRLLWAEQSFKASPLPLRRRVLPAVCEGPQTP